MAFTLLVIVIAIALVFDFVNGFHDAANSIATVVATRVLTPFKAVLWAAFWNFIAFAVLGTHVAKFIATGVLEQKLPDGSVDAAFISIGVIFAALVGAVFWNVLTAWLGLPSSSSHALIGGLVGAGIAKAGGHVILLDGLEKTGTFIIYSPLIGLALGLVLIILIMWLFSAFKNTKMTNKLFRRMQLVSAAAFSLGHGANDAQKTMGIIFALLLGSGHLKPGTEEIPLWIVLSAHTAIGLGTMFGGWKIVKTMGNKLTRLQPMGGFAAETAAAATLFFASAKGIPVSTTHTITGAIVGVGSSQRLSAVRWGVAGRVVWAWILTIPGAAIVSALSYYLVVAVS